MGGGRPAVLRRWRRCWIGFWCRRGSPLSVVFPGAPPSRAQLVWARGSPDFSSSIHHGQIWMEAKKKLMQWFFATASAVPAVVSPEAVFDDFPYAVWWAPAIQGLGSFSSGAPSSAPVHRLRRRDLEGLDVIFLCFRIYL